ncbi:ryanodine receptor 3, brain [Culex quinquefasciatus]|uniref:Ryanodine receptor 3, brain n=1 Tax=Culex quinquefasciatus TaxID=7176 RepID=B0W6C0_CULQU|nr:ryanodine receptor 3, brain [Culex quinquefasciatus]|eukprot:XP_001844254.1 ryanodine receptor 3, brain [Culex quinquefasciatus]
MRRRSGICCHGNKNNNNNNNRERYREETRGTPMAQSTYCPGSSNVTTIAEGLARAKKKKTESCECQTRQVTTGTRRRTSDGDEGHIFSPRHHHMAIAPKKDPSRSHFPALGKLFPSANGSRPHNIAPTPAQLPPNGTHSTWAPNGTYVGGVVIFRFPEEARTNFCHTFQPANTLPGVATDAPKSAFVLLHNWQLEIKEKFCPLPPTVREAAKVVPPSPFEEEGVKRQAHNPNPYEKDQLDRAKVLPAKPDKGLSSSLSSETPTPRQTASTGQTGESSPEDGGPDAAGAGEFPITLVDLLGGEAPKRAAQERSEAQKAQEATLSSIEVESKKTSAEPKEPTAVTQIDFSKYSKKAVSYLARNFYNLKYVALVLAFGINFMLLFYKLTTFGDDEEAAEGSGEDLMGLASGMGSGLVDAVLEGMMRIAACLHSLVSLCLLIAYSHLKIPLAIFKREKEIARRLEFDGRFIAEQPEDDDIKSHWDKLVISAKTFPVNYWDKFVKKKVSIKTFLLLNCKLPPEAEQVQRGLLEVVPMVVVFFESVKTRTTLQRRPASARRDRKQLHNKIRTLPGPGST